jgi:hypothetical protein
MPALGNRRLAGLQPLGSSPGGFFEPSECHASLGAQPSHGRLVRRFTSTVAYTASMRSSPAPMARGSADRPPLKTGLGVRGIAKRFGIHPGTVQKLASEARPFAHDGANLSAGQRVNLSKRLAVPSLLRYASPLILRLAATLCVLASTPYEIRPILVGCATAGADQRLHELIELWRRESVAYIP